MGTLTQPCTGSLATCPPLGACVAAVGVGTLGQSPWPQLTPLTLAHLPPTPRRLWLALRKGSAQGSKVWGHVGTQDSRGRRVVQRGWLCRAGCAWAPILTVRVPGARGTLSVCRDRAQASAEGPYAWVCTSGCAW